MTKLSLSNAILAFAYTGVLAPHRRPVDYVPPRVVSTVARKHP